MRFPRSCGTLVHPTSFPSRYAMGDFGEEARTFLDFLVDTDQTVWQVLPLGPTGYGNSPYASYSAFAGNPYLVSPDILVDKGLLEKEEVEEVQQPSKSVAEYEKAFDLKQNLFERAARRFYKHADQQQQRRMEAFKQEHQHWLDDFTLFMTCLEQYDFALWNEWDPDLAQRKSESLREFSDKFSDRIDYHYWVQFEFFNQWNDLRSYANERGIRVVGDIPIFVDHNSADVWANSQYFEVDEQGKRTKVAGVPPDYFSETGQLWGNPLYRWDNLQADHFSWWIQRFEQMFKMYDAIRVDHFRGFEAYWEIDADEETAVNGEWIKAPGEKLFDTVHEELGEVPIIAEDLGVMTPEVEALRDKYNLPGMKILQFAFNSDSANDFLPHNYHPNSVVYTGTHDNDTTLGWYESAPEQEKDFLRRYVRSDGSSVNWELIRLGMLSVADQAIFPLQDFMNLGNEHRMNLPGEAEGNWLWRYTADQLNQVDKEHIKKLVNLSNRQPDNEVRRDH
mgnify:CR=1 FL=1